MEGLITIIGLSTIWSWAYLADFDPEEPLPMPLTKMIGFGLAVPGIIVTIVILLPIGLFDYLGSKLNSWWAHRGV